MESPPPKGIIKVNWDASVNINAGYVGVGIIARDGGRNFLGARSVTKKVWADPKTAEAMTALCAITFSKKNDVL